MTTNPKARVATRMAALLLGGCLMTATAMASDATAQASVNCTPLGKLRGDAQRGAVLHRKDCAECHGSHGKAEAGVKHMDAPPRNQDDASYMKTLPDEFLYLAICRGGGAVGRNVMMPAWGNILSDRDIKDLVAWIRTFSGT